MLDTPLVAPVGLAAVPKIRQHWDGNVQLSQFLV